MTSSHLDRVLEELAHIRRDISEVKSDTRVTTEKLEHVPSWDDIKEEITQRIEIAQIKCGGTTTRKQKQPMTWGTVAKISALMITGLTPVAVAVASIWTHSPTQ